MRRPFVQQRNRFVESPGEHRQIHRAVNIGGDEARIQVGNRPDQLPELRDVVAVGIPEEEPPDPRVGAEVGVFKALRKWRVLPLRLTFQIRVELTLLLLQIQLSGCDVEHRTEPKDIRGECVIAKSGGVQNAPVRDVEESFAKLFTPLS